MLKKLRFCLICVIFYLICVISVFAEEAITITTYYPSPYGSYNELTTTGNTYLATTSGNNVGIGTTSPGSYKLYVNGSLMVNNSLTDKMTNVVWTNPSDIRLKNITGDFNYGLKEVMKLKPIRYHFKQGNIFNASTEEEHIGFIAQEVEKVIPEAVTKGEDGYLRFTADAVLWSMLNAIKEVKAENEALKARISALEAKLIK